VPELLQALLYDYVPDILERRGPHREEHLRLIAEASDDGRLVMAGPVGDPPASAFFAWRTPDAAEAFAQADPYVANGLVTSWRVEPYNVVTPLP
jgi:uncharacterized protein YciI